jgi:hypothetical protein
MAACEVLERCPFFNDVMTGMPEHAELFKQLYCHGGNDICARYMIFKKLGRDGVPENLFPNEVSRANTIIADARKLAKKS